MYYEGLCLKKLSAEANKGLIQRGNICQHQNLTVVRKKDIHKKGKCYRGGGLPLWEAKHKCWQSGGCQIYPLTFTCVLAISRFLGYSKSLAETSVGSVRIVRATKCILNQRRCEANKKTLFVKTENRTCIFFPVRCLI